MAKRKVTRGRSSALNIASSRLLMRNRSSANRKFSFDLPSHLLPVKASGCQTENTSESDNSSSNLSNKDYAIQPNRGSEGSRPLMSKRDPTRRNFAFSLPSHLLPVQKERNVQQDSDIGEISEEGSLIHQSIKTTGSVQTSKVTSAVQESTSKHSSENSHKSNIQEPWNQTNVFSKTSQTAENMETPFLQRGKVAIVRRLVNKFSSTTHQDVSQGPHTKNPVSELKHNSYIENEKPGSSVQNVSESCHAESEGDSLHESDIPSVHPETDVQHDKNALSPSHSESSIIMDKENINSDIRLLKTWVSKSVGQIEENASYALRHPLRPTAGSVSLNGIGAKEGSSYRNQEISKEQEQKILNSFSRSRVGTALKSKLPIIDPHARNKYHSSLQDDIRFISPMKSTTHSEASHVNKHSESNIQMRAASDQEDSPGVMSNLEMHNKKRQSVFEKFIETENIRLGDKNVSLQRSSILGSVDPPRDLSGRSHQAHNKEQAKKVKFNDDMILEVPSVLHESWLLGAGGSRPPDSKIFYLSEENLAYFEERLPPVDLMFEVEELGDGVNSQLRAMPKAKRKSKQTVVDPNIADQEVLVYKKTALRRRLNDIIDLEVAFTVICEAFSELREEQTEAALRELLDKYEDGVRKDMTDVIKNAIDFASTTKRMKRLEREAKKQGKEVARILDKKMSIQEQLFRKENEEEKEEEEEEEEDADSSQ